MREKALEKLKDWFDDEEFQYDVLEETNDKVIFLTVCNGYSSDETIVEMYRVFKVGDKLEISKDAEQVINKHSISIIATVKDMIKAYMRVCED